MFRAIRELFRRTCKDCEYYSWHGEPDKLLPNKKVIPGNLLCESCEKMDCRLNDLRACDMFKYRSRTHNSFHAYRIHAKEGG